jgi:hypothetical protein
MKRLSLITLLTLLGFPLGAMAQDNDDESVDITAPPAFETLLNALVTAGAEPAEPCQLSSQELFLRLLVAGDSNDQRPSYRPKTSSSACLPSANFVNGPRSIRRTRRP